MTHSSLPDTHSSLPNISAMPASCLLVMVMLAISKIHLLYLPNFTKSNAEFPKNVLLNSDDFSKPFECHQTCPKMFQWPTHELTF